MKASTPTISDSATRLLRATADLEDCTKLFDLATYTAAANELIRAKLAKINTQSRLVLTTKGMIRRVAS